MKSLHEFWRPLGGTGMQVSPLGLGTVKLGRTQGVKYPHPFQCPDDLTALKLLSLTKDLGVNVLDTAPAYGLSESRLGHLLLGQRDQWILMSKIGEQWTQGQSHFDFSADAAILSVEASLKRLQTHWLDVLMIHSDGNDAQHLSNEPLLHVMDQLKVAGKIRAWGISTKSPQGTATALGLADVVMATYNAEDTHEMDNFNQAKSSNTAILVKKFFNSGHVKKKLGVEESSRPLMRELFKLPAVSSIVIGSINPLHVQENIQDAWHVLNHGDH